MTKDHLIQLHGSLGLLEVHIAEHGAPANVNDILADIRRVEEAVEKIVNKMP